MIKAESLAAIHDSQAKLHCPPDLETLGDIGSRRLSQRGGAIIQRSHGAVVTDTWRPRTDGSEQLGESHD